MKSTWGGIVEVSRITSGVADRNARSVTTECNISTCTNRRKDFTRTGSERIKIRVGYRGVYLVM